MLGRRAAGLPILVRGCVKPSERKNSLGNKAQLAISSLLDLLDGLLGVVVVDNNVRAEALDVLEVGRARRRHDSVTGELSELNGVGSDGAGSTPDEDGRVAVAREGEGGALGRDRDLEVGEDEADGGREGEGDRRGFLKADVLRELGRIEVRKNRVLCWGGLACLERRRGDGDCVLLVSGVPRVRSGEERSHLWR